MPNMSRQAKAYVSIVIGAGIVAATAGSDDWRIPHTAQFIFLFALAVLASRLKVALPGVTGTLSVNFIFILVAVMEFGRGPTLVIGSTATLAQCLWRLRHRPPLVQLAFNFANALVCTSSCYAVFHSSWLRAIDDGIPVMLFWSTLVYFVANTAVVSGIIALTEGKKLYTVWQSNFFWTAPQYLLGAGIAALVHVLNQYVGWQHAVLVWPGIYVTYRSYHLYLGKLAEEKKHVAEMAELHLQTIEALALAIDAKDETTHDHLRRVQVYSLEIARQLGIEEGTVQAIKAASLLHDIGKLAVPEYIISKPGRLTTDEFEKMKIHPVVGAEILECVNFPYPVVPIVRSHHEKWDGSGYPDGLKGEDIPIGARILSAVDCLDALASDRPYRRAMPLAEAMRLVAGEAGKSYDPAIVEILAERYPELEEMARQAPAGNPKISKRKLVVKRGEAPAAGLEEVQQSIDERQSDFISRIAAARQEFQMLHEMTRDLGSSLSLEDTFTLLADRLGRLIPHHCVAIYVLKEDHVKAQYVRGDDAALFQSLAIPLGDGISGWVAENRMPNINGNPSVEPGYLNDPSKFSLMNSALSVPLEGISGTVGVLTLYHKDRNAFSRDNLRILTTVSSKVALTLENASQFHLAQKSASTDALTGLPNTRSLFVHLESEVKKCGAAGQPLSVLVLDLDGFKRVNDVHGHLQGNKVLQQVAQGLRSLCRTYDFIARMGGDEFVVILSGLGVDGANMRAQDFESMVEQVGKAVCGSDDLALSVGVAEFPADGDEPAQLLSVADKRMYSVKQSHHAAKAVRTPRPERFLTKTVQ